MYRGRGRSVNTRPAEGQILSSKGKERGCPHGLSPCQNLASPEKEFLQKPYCRSTWSVGPVPIALEDRKLVPYCSVHERNLLGVGRHLSEE